MITPPWMQAVVPRVTDQAMPVPSMATVLTELRALRGDVAGAGGGGLYSYEVLAEALEITSGCWGLPDDGMPLLPADSDGQAT